MNNNSITITAESMGNAWDLFRMELEKLDTIRCLPLGALSL